MIDPFDPLSVFGPEPDDPLDIFGPEPDDPKRRHLLRIPESPRPASLLGLPSSEEDDLSRKRAEMARIRDTGDIGREDIPVGPLTGFLQRNAPGGLAATMAPHVEMFGEALKESIGGPAVGLAERTGRAVREFGEEHPVLASTLPPEIRGPLGLTTMVPEGMRESVRGEFERSRENYLAANPDRAAAGLGMEMGAGAVPFLPGMTRAASALGGGTARLASRLAPETLEAGSAASRFLSRGVGGGIEGGVIGLGNVSPDLPFSEQARQIGMSAFLGSAMGGLGAAQEVAGLEARGAFQPNGRLKGAPPKAPKESTQEILAAFEAERQQALAAVQQAAPDLPPAELATVQQGALKALEQRWQPILARAGASGDTALGAMADQMQGAIAPEIKAPSPIPRLQIGEQYTYRGVRKSSLMKPEERMLVARDTSGNDVGMLWYTKEPDGGFSVRRVETTGRGTGAARQLHRAAFEAEGPYRGATAFTEQGEGFYSRLRETDPDIFGAASPKPASVPINSEAGLRQRPNLSALDRVMAPSESLQSDPGYVYHATNLENAYEIASGGVKTYRPNYGTDQSSWPDGTTERRSYWTAAAQIAWQFAPEGGRPVILRMHQAPYLRRETTGDIYSRQRIPPGDLEILTNRGWEPLTAKAPVNPEAGFLRLGRNKPPGPPPSPIERVMPRNEPTAPGGGPLARLQAIGDKVTDQWFNREDAPVRRVRRAGMNREADFLESMFGRARGAGGMIDPSRRAGPVYEGTYVYDHAINESRRTGDGLQAVVGGMDDNALFDLDALLASQRHMELAGRQEAARLQYDWNRAQRLEQLRQARQADKASLRSMSGDIRTKQAQAIQAARQEARSTGEYRAFLISEGRIGRATPLRRHLGPAESSTDLAASRLGNAIPQAARTRTDALGSIGAAQRVAMGIRDAATRRVPKVKPPPDIDLKIDPEGTTVAQQTLADLEQRYGVDVAPDGTKRIRTLSDIADKFRDWTVRAWMIPLKEAGRFTDAEFHYQINADGTINYGGDILAKNDFYAPFQRLMEVLGDEGEAVYGLPPVASGKANPIHAISGGLSSKLPISRPTQAAVELAQKAVYWTERQRVRNVFADAVDSSPELQMEIRKVPPGPGEGPKTGLPIQQRGSFTAWKDGTRSDYAAPPDVLRAFEVLTPKQAGFIAQAGAVAARTLRAGATITLEFPFRNLGRDVQDAAVYGQGYNPIYKIFVDPFAGLLDVAVGGKWSREWRSNGGALSGATAVGRPQIEAMVRDISAKPTGPLGMVKRRWKAEGWVGKIAFPALAPMEALAGGLESATKVGAYRRMRLRGVSGTEAAVRSRDVSSPDFGRAGTVGRTFNQYEAFFNAELQDAYRIGRAFRRAPFATTVKAMTYLTLPAVANWYKNKDDEQYQALPEWERVAFYHVAKLDNGRWVRIPRPLGMINLAFSYGPQKFIESMNDQDPDAAAEFGRSLMQNTPLHYLSSDALPTAIQPAIEAGAGPGGWSKFRQGPVVPMGLQGALPEDQAFDHTSGAARAIGHAIGANPVLRNLPGGEELSSPLKVDHLIQGYGAFWGRTLAQATGPMARTLGANPEEESFAGRLAQGGSPQLPTQAKDIPGVRGFISSPAIGFASDPVTRFYELSTRAAQAAKSLKMAEEAGNSARYQAILREAPEVVLSDTLTDVREELNAMRKERNEILHAPGLSKEKRLEMVLQIDQAVAQLAGMTMHGAADYLRGQR